MNLSSNAFWWIIVLRNMSLLIFLGSNWDQEKKMTLSVSLASCPQEEMKRELWRYKRREEKLDVQGGCCREMKQKVNVNTEVIFLFIPGIEPEPLVLIGKRSTRHFLFWLIERDARTLDFLCRVSRAPKKKTILPDFRFLNRKIKSRVFFVFHFSPIGPETLDSQ